MLDKPTKDMEPAPGWRFPRFLRFGDNGDATAQPKAKKPPSSLSDLAGRLRFGRDRGGLAS